MFNIKDKRLARRSCLHQSLEWHIQRWTRHAVLAPQVVNVGADPKKSGGFRNDSDRDFLVFFWLGRTGPTWRTCPFGKARGLTGGQLQPWGSHDARIMRINAVPGGEERGRKQPGKVMPRLFLSFSQPWQLSKKINFTHWLRHHQSQMLVITPTPNYFLSPEDIGWEEEQRR